MKRLIWILAVAAAGCSNPTIPTPGLPVTGFVFDAASSAPISGALVRFSDGIGGTDLTDQRGAFRLTRGNHSGPYTIEVEKAGDQAQKSACCMNFWLEPFDGRVFIPTGEYAVTFTFDPACAIPSELRTHSFTATVKRYPSKGPRQGAEVIVRESNFGTSWGFWGYPETPDGIFVPDESDALWTVQSNYFVAGFVTGAPIDPFAISVPFYGGLCTRFPCGAPVPRGETNPRIQCSWPAFDNRVTLTPRF